MRWRPARPASRPAGTARRRGRSAVAGVPWPAWHRVSRGLTAKTPVDGGAHRRLERGVRARAQPHHHHRVALGPEVGDDGRAGPRATRGRRPGPRPGRASSGCRPPRSGPPAPRGSPPRPRPGQLDPASTRPDVVLGGDVDQDHPRACPAARAPSGSVTSPKSPGRSPRPPSPRTDSRTWVAAARAPRRHLGHLLGGGAGHGRGRSGRLGQPVDDAAQAAHGHLAVARGDVEEHVLVEGLAHGEPWPLPAQPLQHPGVRGAVVAGQQQRAARQRAVGQAHQVQAAAARVRCRRRTGSPGCAAGRRRGPSRSRRRSRGPHPRAGTSGRRRPGPRARGRRQRLVGGAVHEVAGRHGRAEPHADEGEPRRTGGAHQVQRVADAGQPGRRPGPGRAGRRRSPRCRRSRSAARPARSAARSSASRRKVRWEARPSSPIGGHSTTPPRASRRPAGTASRTAGASRGPNQTGADALCTGRLTAPGGHRAPAPLGPGRRASRPCTANRASVVRSRPKPKQALCAVRAVGGAQRERRPEVVLVVVGRGDGGRAGTGQVDHDLVLELGGQLVGRPASGPTRPKNGSLAASSRTGSPRPPAPGGRARPRRRGAPAPGPGCRPARTRTSGTSASGPGRGSARAGSRSRCTRASSPSAGIAVGRVP